MRPIVPILPKPPSTSNFYPSHHLMKQPFNHQIYNSHNQPNQSMNPFLHSHPRLLNYQEQLQQMKMKNQIEFQQKSQMLIAEVDQDKPIDTCKTEPNSEMIPIVQIKEEPFDEMDTKFHHDLPELPPLYSKAIMKKVTKKDQPLEKQSDPKLPSFTNDTKIQNIHEDSTKIHNFQTSMYPPLPKLHISFNKFGNMSIKKTRNRGIKKLKILYCHVCGEIASRHSYYGAQVFKQHPNLNVLYCSNFKFMS